MRKKKVTDKHGFLNERGEQLFATLFDSEKFLLGLYEVDTAGRHAIFLKLEDFAKSRAIHELFQGKWEG